MSLRSKLVVIICFVALVPLSVSAFTALRIHRGAYEQQVDELQDGAARNAAALASERLNGLTRHLELAASSVPWDRLSGAEREGALWLVYQQSDAIAVASLFDADGTPRETAALVAPAERDGRFGSHPLAPPELLQSFGARAPLASARRGTTSAGAPFFVENAAAPMWPIAVPLGDAASDGLTLGVAVSLGPLCRRLGQLAEAPLVLTLADDAGRRICAGGEPADLTPIATELRGADASAPIEYRHDGTTSRAVVAPLPALGWSLIAEQPRSEATAAGDRMLLQTIFWIGVGLIIAVASGLYLARGIHGPLAELTRGAHELGRGNLGYRIPLERERDELGALARTFNQMAVDLEARNAEIEEWNRELADRVDARTRELKAAQRQLVNSEKIAAVSSLAAGIAHEVNNPLTGVLGLTQVLRARAEADGDERRARTLTSIEGEATRIRDIIQTLLTFSSEHERKGMATLEVGALLEATVDLARSQAAERDTQIRVEADDDLHVRGNDSQLRQALLHLVNNALAAMPDGGTLTIEARSVEGELVRIRVSDTGRGIAPEHLGRVFEPFFTTKEVWEGRGLGLTVAHRVIEEHHGTIEIESEPDQGTTVTVTLPVASGGAHLV